MHFDKAIQVNDKIRYRTKGINFNLYAMTKSAVRSPFYA